MSLSFLSAVRRFPVFLPSAKLVAAALVATVIVAPVEAWEDPIGPIGQPSCLPGYTAEQVPLPGSQGTWLQGRMTWRCVANWTGSAPNIPSTDPTRRSTVILSLAGPGTVNGCGDGHETRINIRATGGFFAEGHADLVRVRVSRDFTTDKFDFENQAAGSWNPIDGSFTINVSEGDNYSAFRHRAMPENAGKHVIRLKLEEAGLRTEKYRIAPTGAIQIVFDLDGPGCENG